VISKTRRHASSRRPRWARRLRNVCICVVLLALVRICFYRVGWLHNLDGLILDDALLSPRSWLVGPTSFVGDLLKPLPFALWTICLACLALFRRQPKSAMFVILLCVCATATTETLKPILAQQRYFELLGSAQIFADAFPSGHATAALSLAVSAFVSVPPAWRRLTVACGVVFFICASYSVLALGWHYPSDVVGGLLVVALWVALLENPQTEALVPSPSPRRELGLKSG
jgi:membrane-associated phospholipid phosphatase